MANYKDNKVESAYHIYKFIGGVFLLTWIPWLMLVFLGDGIELISSKLLIGLGGAGPALMTFFLLKKYHSRVFIEDFIRRVINAGFLKQKYSYLVLLPVPGLFLSILISATFLGESWGQLIPNFTGLQCRLGVQIPNKIAAAF